MVGGAVVLFLPLIVFGAIAAFPFAAGLLGCSLRIVYWMIGIAAVAIVTALGSSIFEQASRAHATDARDVLLWWLQTGIGMLLAIAFTALAIVSGYGLGVKARAGLLWLRRRIWLSSVNS